MNKHIPNCLYLPLCQACGHTAWGHTGNRLEDGRYPHACDYKVQETKQWCRCTNYDRAQLAHLGTLRTMTNKEQE